ncbi:unnamed protein product, partial [Laminaria digitata]
GLANHVASHTLASALKTVGSHDTGRLLNCTIKRLSQELDTLEDARKAVVDAGGVAVAVAAAATLGAD